MHKMKFWIFIHLLGFLHAAKNSLIVPSNILRHAEWIQELSVNGTVCRVLESREMAVTPISHCCSPSHCEQHADVQTFSPRGDTVVVRGFASRCPGGDRYICLTNAIIPFAIVNAGREYISSTFPFSSCYEPANATLRYNSVNTNIFSDFVLRMVCSDSRLNVALPRSQLRPLPTHPFVFLHVDKVAGTMLRKFLFDTAVRNGYMQYIPCFGQVHCVLYDFKPVYGDGLDNEISIIAGHFPWGVWSRLPGYAAVAHNTVPPCFIMFRNPVSRAVSYFYKRVHVPGHPFFGQTLNQMSEEQIRFMLTSVRHQAFLADNVTKVVADEGASDAVCRQLLNARRTSGQPLTINIPDDTLGEDDALNAFHNAQQCIIGMQDDMDSTYLILKHWFPWIIISDKQHSKVNAGGRPDDAADVLNAHVIRAILSVNTCDALLYHKARERFWQQVEFLTQYRGNV